MSHSFTFRRSATLAVLAALFPLLSHAQNVGVDVPAPQQKLDVAGGLRIGNTTNGLAGSIRWTGSAFEGHDGFTWIPLGAGGSFWSTAGNSGTAPATQFIGTTDNVDLRFRIDNTERAVLNTNGNLGVGTMAPTHKLDVFGGIKATNPAAAPLGSDIILSSPAGDLGIIMNRGNGSGASQQRWDIKITNDNALRFRSQNTTDYFAFTNTGNLGIGTNTPAAKLHVVGSVRMVDGTQGAGKVMVSDANGTASWASSSTLAPNRITDADNDTKVQVEESADEDIIRFDVAGAEVFSMRKTGTNSPYFQVGSSSVLIGQSISSTVTGNWNAVIGYQSGMNLTTGNKNAYFGDNAGGFNTTGSDNTMIGTVAGQFNNGGSGNTMIGGYAGRNNLTGSFNVFLGHNAGTNETGSNKLYIANSATANPLIKGDFSAGILTVNGNLGISAATPAEKLHIAGKLRMADGTEGSGKVMVSDVNGSATWTDATSLTVTETDPQVSASTPNFIPRWNGTTLVDGAIFDNGNVGIGHNDPLAKLDINGGSDGAKLLRFNMARAWNFSEVGSGTFSRLRLQPEVNTKNFEIVTADASHRLVNFFAQNSGSRVELVPDGIGLVAIGTSAPTSTLHVVGTTNFVTELESSSATGTWFRLRNTSAGGTAWSWIATGTSNSEGAGKLLLRDVAGASVRMTVDANGNVGFGNTAPQEKLHVEGKIRMADGTQGAGKVLVSDASGSASWALPTSTVPNMIADADNDTKIQVEESADEDRIRFDMAGTEYLVMRSGRLNVTNTGGSTFLGADAGLVDDLTNNYNTFLGYFSGKANTTGDGNTAVGAGAMEVNIGGSYNTAMGRTAMLNRTSGDENTAIGAQALYGNTTGIRNTALGFNAGSTNLTGSGNVFVGASAGANETGSNKLYIDNSNTSNPLIHGDFSSDILTVNGSVGIGTDSPASRLEIQSTSGASVILTIDQQGADNHSGIVLQRDAAEKWHVGMRNLDDHLRIRRNDSSTSLVVNNASGFVGVGSSANLDAPLHVNVNHANAQLLVSPSAFSGQDAALAIRGARTSISDTDQSSVKFQNYDQLSGNTSTLATIAARVTNSFSNIGDLIFYNSVDGTAQSETMRLTSGGNAGIGSNNPQEKLHVEGKIRMADGTQGAGKVLVSDANGSASWSLGTENVAYAKNTGTFNHDNTDGYDVITGTATLNVISGDVITIMANASVRLTGGSGVDDFFFRASYTGCASGNTNETNYFPSEDSNDHDNYAPISYLDVLVAPCTGTLNFQFNARNVGDDPWQAEDRVLVVRRN